MQSSVASSISFKNKICILFDCFTCMSTKVYMYNKDVQTKQSRGGIFWWKWWLLEKPVCLKR